MNVDSGEIVSSPAFSDTELVQTLAYDATEDAGFGVVEVDSQKRFCRIDLGTLNVTALGGDSYGALDAYTQFNSAVSAPGVHLVTAYRADASLWLLALDLDTGDVLLERERNATAGLSPNFADMAFWAGA